MRGCVASILLLMAVPATAGPLQDAYNAAQAALDAGKDEEAAQGFAALLAKLPNDTKPGGRTAALIRARLGSAYMRMNDAASAIGPLERARADMPTATEADRRERLTVQIDLARALDASQERVRAKQAYRDALADASALQSELEVLNARLGLGRLSVFDDPATARQELDTAIQLAVKLKVDGEPLASVYGLRGRVELNHGDLPAAKKWFELGLKSAGGMGRKVSVIDTRIRSDLGIVNFLLGNQVTAREYFAFTGAGRLPDGGITSGAETPLPYCGAATGVDPADMVIVDFTIAGDGRVLAPTTVYSTRPGVIEDAFERSVASWSWNPDSLAKLNQFWRNSVRLQLRCVGTGARGSVDSDFWREWSGWAKSKGLSGSPVAASDVLQLPLLRAELARRASVHGPMAPQLLPVLLGLASNSIVSRAEAKDTVKRVNEILLETDVPTNVRIQWELVFETMLGSGGGTKTSYSKAYARAIAQTIPALLARIEARGEGATKGAVLVRLTLATMHETSGDKAVAQALFSAVVATPFAVLPDGHPMRQVALLRLASIAASNRQIGVARAALDATGLSPDQCAIVDASPLKKLGGASQFEYPPEAMGWGFGGFTQVAYDIDAAGKPLNVRTVIAYPPFIFSKVVEEGVRRFRYEPMFRDGANAGCGGMMQGINFKGSAG